MVTSFHPRFPSSFQLLWSLELWWWPQQRPVPINIHKFWSNNVSVCMAWIFDQEPLEGKLSTCEFLRLAKCWGLIWSHEKECIWSAPPMWPVTKKNKRVPEVNDHQCHSLSMPDHISEFLKYASSAWPPLLTPDWPGLPLEAPEQSSFTQHTGEPH